MKKATIAFILGIRPDVIRASLIIDQLRSYTDLDFVFIWSGQHYSDNLKSIFFRELNVAPAEIDLGCGGETDAEIVGAVIAKLYGVLARLRPAAAIFLGDTNTTAGAIAAAQLNIPIVHIEGCMRSYDWRMPEEKYRTIIDHLSDVIYAYFDEYKEQGIREGLNPDSIVVVGNPIVDVLNHFYFSQHAKFAAASSGEFFQSRSIERYRYYLMTCHRRENVESFAALSAIIDLIAAAPYKVYFPASYRIQKVLHAQNIAVPKNVIMVDPVGYEEMLILTANARGVITDSGTVVEETCALHVPSIQMRRSTERPQVYDVGSSVKFDPTNAGDFPPELVFAKLESLFGRPWDASILGDGKASQRIAEDLHRRLISGGLARHAPENYHIPTARSYRDDGLAAPAPVSFRGR